MTPQEEFYNSILEEMESGELVLPTLPEVALQVRDVAGDPNATSAQLAEIIGTDAALSARLLKVANSPLYRGRIPVETIQMAVSRLGMQMVRNLVTSLVMDQMFQSGDATLNKRLRGLWEHSTKVSATAQVLANKCVGVKTDEAMLGGLIHAIGVLPVLIRAQKKEPELFNDEVKMDRLIDTIYTKLGGAILERWEFPEKLINVAREHKDLNRDSGPDGPDLIDVVQVAVLQSYIGTDKALDPLTLNEVPAFEKVGADTGFSLEEIDEDSEEYAEAMALFGF
jgi:HD-like signal output (HDOD) protein